MAIRLTRIYTRSGDRGLTALVGGVRVPKESARLEAYGTIDELNSIVGIVRSYLPGYKRRFGKDYGWYSESLRRIQNELFDVGSELATPPPAEYAGMHKMSAAEAKKLEEEMDRMQQELKPLNSFTLPGGGPLNAFLGARISVGPRVANRSPRCGDGQTASGHSGRWREWQG